MPKKAIVTKEKKEKIEKIKAMVTLEKITGNTIFRIFSLLVVLGVGIYFLLTMGIDTKLLNSKEYEIYYNNEVDEYYLLVDDNYSSVDLSLYRPNRVDKMTLYHYDINNHLIEEKVLKKEEKVSLNTYKDDYYVIKSKYSNQKEQSLKILVYKQSDI